MTSESYELLDTARDLLSFEWVSIRARGGTIGPQPGHCDDRIDQGDLVVETERGLVRLGALALDDVDRTESFFLTLKRIDEIGTTESERMWRPRRRAVAAFPDDLQLGLFIGRRPSAMSLLHDAADAAEAPLGLVLELDGLRFAFWADDLLPASLACSTASDVVSRLVDRCLCTEVRRLVALLS